ncbi:TIGR02594 family protein [Bradyrhizobium sp. ARR65]|uniref:TIGR02594 family protein n=1 Tax=Bradyrhizobium sp. ARR65 TaxID=1040989 RepID=UPI00046532D8|nr:TIGR02594 family protein [Bradyrhizobium sp. ARR65]
MVAFSAFGRSLVALAFCSAAVAVSSPASARSHHGSRHHAQSRHASHHFAKRHVHHHRTYARASRSERGVAQMGSDGFDVTQSGAASSGVAMSGGFSGSSLIAEARRYLGGNPTGRGSLWCARFLNMVLERTGHRGTGSDLAASFAHYGQRVSGPEVGAIAVMSRRGGGHVGIITGIDARGNPIMISGNNGHRVREAAVSRGRIYAYVMPN